MTPQEIFDTILIMEDRKITKALNETSQENYTPVLFLQWITGLTDYDWLNWSEEKINQYNKDFDRKGKKFDWEKDVEISEVEHFPIEFAEKLADDYDYRIGISGLGKIKSISFANYRKHLVKIKGKVYLVKLNF